MDSIFSLSPGFFIAGLILAIGISVIIKGLVVVRQSEVMVIERLGSYHRLLESGINLIIPFIEQPRAITMVRYRKMGEEYQAVTSHEARIDRRETVMDFPGQPVVTTDNVTVRINGALYYQIIDPKRAVYEVENMSQAVEVLAKTTLRSVVGKMELDRLFESRAEVNNEIQAAMEEPASKWGVKISRVEVQDIAMPGEVEEAMRLQMAAERKRRATVTEAEGEKAAAIAMAQGQRESAILNAQGTRSQRSCVPRASRSPSSWCSAPSAKKKSTSAPWSATCWVRATSRRCRTSPRTESGSSSPTRAPHCSAPWACSASSPARRRTPWPAT